MSWNNSMCECDKSCDYVNFKCRKKLINKLVKKCGEDIDGNEMFYNATLYDYGLNKNHGYQWCLFFLSICLKSMLV